MDHQHKFETQMAPEEGVTYYEMCECGATLAIMPVGFNVVFSKDGEEDCRVLCKADTQSSAEAMLYNLSTNPAIDRI